ncbi:unnamed protein product [Rhizophagus irregularis]|nr:unnamed protein product [Rhizophagus irregularis]
MNCNNKDEIQIKSEFNELGISVRDSNINHESCYAPRGAFKTLWCKECVPHCIIEGWTSGNYDIDKFIKNTIYNAKYDNNYEYLLFLEWVPFDRFEDIKLIGEGGFAEVYSSIWIDGKAKYLRKVDGSWKKREPKPMKVALKKLNESQIISADYLNELRTHWKLYYLKNFTLKFYGMTKDPETKEFMMIIQLADQGNLRCVLSNNFNNISWKKKLLLLENTAYDLKKLHELGYFHKDFHSGNILLNYNKNAGDNISYISDFGLSGLGMATVTVINRS